MTWMEVVPPGSTPGTGTAKEDTRRRVREMLSRELAGLVTEEMKKIAEEMKKKDHHAHDFSDDDIVTVKEIREAWDRGSSTSARNSLQNFLQDISQHRENFPLNAVVEDPEGNIWRLQHTRWQVFNSTMTVSYETPRRPLRQIGVDSRHDS